MKYYGHYWDKENKLCFIFNKWAGVYNVVDIKSGVVRLARKHELYGYQHIGHSPPFLYDRKIELEKPESWDKYRKNRKYTITAGTVQAYLCTADNGPSLMYHFGSTQYDRDKPIIRDHWKPTLDAVIHLLNNGFIKFEQACDILDKI